MKFNLNDQTDWIRGGVKDGQRLIFSIVANPCEYGNFYVTVTNIYTYVGYLHPDMTIRTRPAFASGFNGYYLTHHEAEKAVDQFLSSNLKGKVKNMCHQTQIDSKLRSMLKDTVKEFVRNGKMFTAFDVTTRIRDDNPGVRVYHSVVKQYVHDLYDNRDSVFDGYDRTIINISTPPPWCYFIPGVHDPSTYGIVTNPVPQPATTVVKGKGGASFVKRAKSVLVATFGGITGGSS